MLFVLFSKEARPLRHFYKTNTHRRKNYSKMNEQTRESLLPNCFIRGITFSHFPCISKLSAIIIAYYGKWPSFTVREIPSQIKNKSFRSLRSNCFFYCQRSHRIFIWRLFPFYITRPSLKSSQSQMALFHESALKNVRYLLVLLKKSPSDCPHADLFVNSFGYK